MGSKFTRSRLPVSLVYSEEVGGRSEALKREREIKSMKRTQKLVMVAQASATTA